MPNQLPWGILGCGNIARQFAACLPTSLRSTLRAAASRSQATADVFVAPYPAARAYANYDRLLADDAVQAVYIALPNSLHEEWTLKALQSGKHVLCEKPLALNVDQAQRMFDHARQRGLLLAEAFMYRSHPLTDAVLAAIRRGDIGPIRIIRTSFCYRTLNVARNIRFDPTLGGGAIMDVGCYCVHFSHLLAGQEPTDIHAIGNIHPTGVDDAVVATLKFSGGILASFTCSMSAQADNTAHICGQDGYIEIPIPWKPGKRSTYVLGYSTPPRMDGNLPPPPPRQTITVDSNLDLYAHEADEFAAAIFDQKPPRITPADTLANMRVLDEIRRQIGLAF